MKDDSNARPNDGFTHGTNLEGLGPDERHYLLADPDRRALLGVLADRTEPIALSDLAVEVAMASAPTTADVTANRREFELVLHHNHLPRLEDAGIVKYDTTSNCIEPGCNSRLLSP